VIAKTWRLVGPDGEPHESACPGTLGGHRRTRIYGRLDCVPAQRAIARGGYLVDRVFFPLDGAKPLRSGRSTLRARRRSRDLFAGLLRRAGRS
jgi:hypothetical protein